MAEFFIDTALAIIVAFGLFVCWVVIASRERGR